MNFVFQYKPQSDGKPNFVYLTRSDLEIKRNSIFVLKKKLFTSETKGCREVMVKQEFKQPFRAPGLV